MIEPAGPAFHGNAPKGRAMTYRPPLSIVISRETGARGRSIAQRVAEILGWEYLDQESLEYLTQGAPAGTSGSDELSGDAADWVDRRLQEMNEDGSLTKNPSIVPLVRRILDASAAVSNVILGRGAGKVIPDDARLHVKIISPIEMRRAYIAQIRRFSPTEAAEFVTERDKAREDFLAAKLSVDALDVAQYDMVINTSQLGVEASARLIASAAREKQDYLKTHQGMA